MTQLEFHKICRENGLQLTLRQRELLGRYVEGLLEWNLKVNLISRRDEENVWLSHILHSISPLFLLEFDQGIRLLDLGTGGGLPGVPIAIVRPDIRVTLLDSIRKKTTALEEIVEALKLENVRIATGRAEEVVRWAGFDASYDVVIARAVSRLADLIKISRPFLGPPNEPRGEGEPGGRIRVAERTLVALKGGDLEAEVRQAAVKSTGATIRVLPLVFAGSDRIGLEEKKIVCVTFA